MNDVKALQNITAITMDAKRRILSDAILLFDEGKLIEVDKAHAVALPPNCEVIDGKGRVV